MNLRETRSKEIAWHWLRLIGFAGGTVAVLLAVSMTVEVVGYVQSSLRLLLSARWQRVSSFLLAVGVGILLQRRAGLGQWSRRFESYCEAARLGLLPSLVAGSVVLMAACWLPHYLTWPWWADTDHFAVSAVSWRSGILPYRDLIDYNFPGPTYLMWVLGVTFGWGKTWPLYAFDASWLVLILVALARWSRARFGESLPGLIAGLFVSAFYLNLLAPDVAQRDWYTATLALLAILTLQGAPTPRRPALLMAAAAMAMAMATRPYTVLFLPAVLLASAGTSGTTWEQWRRVASWSAAFGLFVAIAMLPLVVFGIFDDFLRSLAYLRLGGAYNRNSFDGFLLRLYQWRDDGGYLLMAAGLSMLFAIAGPLAHRRASAVWLLAMMGALFYLPLSPVPHGYLRQPCFLFAMVGLGFGFGVLTAIPGLRATVKLLAIATVVVGFFPGLPVNCDPGESLQAIRDLASGRDPKRVPRGATGMFHEGLEDPEVYRWGDYVQSLNYLRTRTGPKTRVANVLRRYPNPPINGPVGRLTPFPHASGILWFRWLGPEREDEFVEGLESATDAVVVWAPEETEYVPSLTLSKITRAIRKHFEPEARFGAIEIWRRTGASRSSPESGLRSTERLAEPFQTFWDGGLGVLVPLELEGDPPAVVVGGQNPGDPVVVEVQLVPAATTVIGLGLNQGHRHLRRGHLLHLLVRVLEEVARVEGGLEPGRVDRLHDPQDSPGRASQSPMVLQAEHNPAFLGSWQERFNRPDDPVERLVLGDARQGRFDSLVRHQGIEGLGRAPSARVDPHRGDAQPAGQFDLVQRFLDVCPAEVGVGINKPLVGREAHQRQSLGVSPAFQVLEGLVRFVSHLNVEEFHPVKAHRGGLVDAGSDVQTFAPELPERIRGDSDRQWLSLRSRGSLVIDPREDRSRGSPGQGRRDKPCPLEKSPAVGRFHAGHFLSWCTSQGGPWTRLGPPLIGIGGKSIVNEEASNRILAEFVQERIRLGTL